MRSTLNFAGLQAGTDAIPSVFIHSAASWAQLSHCGRSFMKGQAMQVVGKVGEGSFGFGALDADASDEPTPSALSARQRHSQRGRTVSIWRRWTWLCAQASASPFAVILRKGS